MGGRQRIQILRTVIGGHRQNTRHVIDVHDRGRGVTPEQAQNFQAYAQFHRQVYEQ